MYCLAVFVLSGTCAQLEGVNEIVLLYTSVNEIARDLPAISQ